MGGDARRHGRLLRDPGDRARPPALPTLCLLDNGTERELVERGFDRPQIAVISGMVKQHMTEFSDGDYRKHVRDLGDRYLATLPRPIALDSA